MTAIVVDTNILLDVLLKQQPWFDWSAHALESAGDGAQLVINPIIYAEVSIGYESIEALNSALPEEFVRREPIPDEAAFLAGKAFTQYRRRGGPRSSLLPDFLIGAHAAVQGYALLTRDVRRFRFYFPTLRLIAPD
ncbi:MAG: type II toxin-antitoxin system VapC family toxin [Alphaproteobacteria bacterium]